MGYKGYKELQHQEEGLLDHMPRLDDRHDDCDSATSRWLRSLRNVLLVVSLATNAFLMVQAHRQRELDIENYVSKFSDLRYNKPIPYEPKTSYSGGNRSELDAVWDALDTDPIVISLTDEYAASRDLPIATSRFPWDESRGLYHVKAYHQVHCLKNIYKAYTSKVDRIPTRIPDGHVYHCLDTLLQDVQCMADDTPMPTYLTHHHIGNGQMRKCRDINAIAEWTRQPGQHACYRMITDYGSVVHTLEEFAFCNADSPYGKVADKYFEKHGHQDPFEGV